MPSVTYDGRSFMLDGRRIWLVSGSVHYARIPSEHWEERIHAARVAGLNTIETPVFWNRHEPRPGQFDFKGDNDLRRFVQLIGQAGMYCILRPGPFVGQEWDFGGFPPWLAGVKGIRLRVANGPYLEACSRYLTAVVNQVRDLQVTSPGKGNTPGGPIILVQNESNWTCGDDQQAAAYLGEINRYLREAGMSVPTINSNNLWQGTEGEIDCWSGFGDLMGTVRQLGAVRPNQPRLVIEFNVGAPGVWGQPAPEAVPPGVLQQQLAQILAAGGQFNIHPFHGGTNFGFWGGKLSDIPGGFVTAGRDHGAPLTEVGHPGGSYQAVRRICTFASRFGRLFANLDPEYRPVVAMPATGADDAPEAKHSRAGKREARRSTIVHASGPQGGVAFIFGPASGEPADGKMNLLLSDGGVLPIDTGGAPVAWCVFDAYLGGRAKLDYCGMCTLATVGRTLVVYGPAGSEGHLSINGSPLQTSVPKGKTPTVVEHEGITVVVCSEEQIDTVYIADDAVFIGAAGISPAGEPIALHGEKRCTRINAEGQSSQVSAAQPPAHARKNGDRIPIAEWTVAGTQDYCDGSSARFASIDGPADLTTLGSPFGYGWYRLRLKSGSGGKVRIAFPHSADRLHVCVDGELAGLVGTGPAAEQDLTVSLAKGQSTMVVLAENLGRASGGVTLGDAKGLFGEVWSIKPLRVPKPVLKIGDPVDVLAFKSPLWEVQPGDTTLPERPTWTLTHRRKTPVMMSIGSFPCRGLLLVNNKPIAYLEPGSEQPQVLQPDQLKAGANLIQVAILPNPGDGRTGPQECLSQLASSVSFEECVASLSAKAEWAFARWEPPRATAFAKPKQGVKHAGPVWWRSSFRAPASGEPILFDAAGLTKGQLYINGRHVCRYFVATADGKPVPPQAVYYIPAPWVLPDQDNEILVFDEHGGNPVKSRLVHG